MVDPTFLAVLIAALLVFGGGMWALDRKQKGGWGPRNVQALGLVMLVPAILILAGMDKIDPSVIATLFGAIIGYILGLRTRPDKPGADE